jgi:hypothetical protein
MRRAALDAIKALFLAGWNLMFGRLKYDPDTEEYVSLFGKRRPAGDPLDTRHDKVDDRWEL